MTEDEAKAWIAYRFGAVAVDRMTLFVRLITDEAPRQNLISASSMASIWTRHIVDSAQLIDHSPFNGLWIDIGTGAGFPGIVVAALTDRQMLLVEPRRRRVDFLQRAVYDLGLGTRTEVRLARIEAVSDKAGTISARAVASVEALMQSADRCATKKTIWVLPKGRAAREEVAQAKKSWHGTFHVEHSITDPESLIVIASGVSRR